MSLIDARVAPAPLYLMGPNLPQGDFYSVQEQELKINSTHSCCLYRLFDKANINIENLQLTIEQKKFLLVSKLYKHFNINIQIRQYKARINLQK